MQIKHIFSAVVLVLAVLSLTADAHSATPKKDKTPQTNPRSNCVKNGRLMLGIDCFQRSSKKPSGRHLLEELNVASLISTSGLRAAGSDAAALVSGRDLLAVDAIAAAAATQKGKKKDKEADEEAEEEEEVYHEEVCNARCQKKAKNGACSGASPSCCCKGVSGCYKISAWDSSIFSASAWAGCKK